MMLLNKNKTIHNNRKKVNFNDRDILNYIEKPFVPKNAYFKFNFSDGCVIEVSKQEIPYWILRSTYTNIRNSSEHGRYVLEFFIDNFSKENNEVR